MLNVLRVSTTVSGTTWKVASAPVARQVRNIPPPSQSFQIGILSPIHPTANPQIIAKARAPTMLFKSPPVMAIAIIATNRTRKPGSGNPRIEISFNLFITSSIIHTAFFCVFLIYR